jgi:hypothetical protein
MKLFASAGKCICGESIIQADYLKLGNTQESSSLFFLKAMTILCREKYLTDTKTIFILFMTLRSFSFSSTFLVSPKASPKSD